MTSTAVRADSSRTDKARSSSSQSSKPSVADDARSPSPTTGARPSTPRRTSSVSKPTPSSDDDRPKAPASTTSSRGDARPAAAVKEQSPAPASRKPTVGTPTTEAPPSHPATGSPSSHNKKPKRPDAQIINMETFGQILEMDDDDETHEFSRSIVWNFFDQASVTLEDIDHAIDSKDLPKISSLGHFLKGSSGALGIDEVQHSCEKMQHYGARRDEEHGVVLSESKALELVTELNVDLKEQYREAEEWLKAYFEEPVGAK